MNLEIRIGAEQTRFVTTGALPTIVARLRHTF
jgi:hypothetical protein